jgi:cyclomaltodextrinase
MKQLVGPAQGAPRAAGGGLPRAVEAEKLEADERLRAPHRPRAGNRGWCWPTAGCAPHPLAGRDLYLRGSFNSWNADEARRFVWACDRFELVTRIDGEHRYKIGSTFGVGLGNHVQVFAGEHTVRLAIDAAGRHHLQVGPRSFADPQAAAVDHPVALGLRFDSRRTAHKQPFGAQPAGTVMHFSVTAPPGVQALTLVLERRRLEGNQEVLDYTETARLPMQRSADGAAERWTVQHRFDAVGIHGYWFEAAIDGQRFVLQNNADPVFWTREKGSGGAAAVGPMPSHPRLIRRFRQTVYAADFRVPDWAADAVYYYVFPERFRNGDPANDPAPGRDRYHRGTVEKHASWLDKPWRAGSGDGSDALHNNDFFGGDLEGLIRNLDHIQALGANTLYLTPIFRAASNHKYDTADYHQVDPAFGSNADFTRLTQAAAQRGLRVVLDASFNHTGADSLYFDRYGHFGGQGAYAGSRIRPESPYASWYRFDATQADPDKRFKGWVGVTDLPELDKASPAWRDFAYRAPDSVTKRWLDAGAAGWRMDVAPWVPDDFWREWRTELKRHKPDAIAIAETWFDAAKFFLGDTFDSTMNYIFRNTALAYAAGGDARQLVGNLELMREHYPPPAFHALMNLLSSHDQARSLHVLGWHDDADPAQERLAKARYRLALLLQMSYPGAPAVYYGDEVGLSGGDDPDNRRPFPWADLGGRPDEDLHAEFRRLIALRNALPVLRRGELGAPLHVDAHVIVLPRRLGETVALTITSNAAEARTVAFELPPAKISALTACTRRIGTTWRPLAQEHRRHVGQHHAQRGAGHHRHQVGVTRGQRHGGDLRLVAHLGQEEGHHRGAEHAQRAWPPAARRRSCRAPASTPPWPGTSRRSPSAARRGPARGHPAAHRTGQRVVGQRGHQDAQRRWAGLAEARGQQQRQQLRLVAHFTQGDDAGRDEKGFHRPQLGAARSSPRASLSRRARPIWSSCNCRRCRRLSSGFMPAPARCRPAVPASGGSAASPAWPCAAR